MLRGMANVSAICFKKTLNKQGLTKTHGEIGFGVADAILLGDYAT